MFRKALLPEHAKNLYAQVLSTLMYCMNIELQNITCEPVHASRAIDK